MKKVLSLTIVTVALLTLAGCGKKEETKKESKEIKSSQQSVVNVSSNQTMSTTPITSTSVSATSQSEPKASETKSADLYTAKNLTADQKREIDQKMDQFCAKRAEMGHMAYSEHLADISGWSAPIHKEYKTVDGPVYALDVKDESQLRNANDPLDCWYPTTGKINAVGGGTFFKHTEGKTGMQEKGDSMAAYGQYMASDSDTHLYLFADNGKVYEANVKGSVDRGGGFDKYYEVSNDKAVTEEYQRLLKEYGGTKQNDQNEDAMQNLTTTVTNYGKEKTGYTYQKEELKDYKGIPTIKGGITTYFADKTKVPEASNMGYLTLDGKDFTFNFDSDKDQYKIIAVYSPDLPGYTQNHIPSYIFAVKNGQKYVFETTENSSLNEIKDGKLVEAFAKVKV